MDKVGGLIWEIRRALYCGRNGGTGDWGYEVSRDRTEADVQRLAEELLQESNCYWRRRFVTLATIFGVSPQERSPYEAPNLNI